MTRQRPLRLKVLSSSTHGHDILRAVYGMEVNGLPPLVVALGEPGTTVWVRARCDGCGALVGQVTEWIAEATGERALLFTGQRVVDRATVADFVLLLHPYRPEPVAECLTCGPLSVTDLMLKTSVALGRRTQREAHAARRAGVEPESRTWAKPTQTLRLRRAATS